MLDIKPGDRLRGIGCTTEVVVIKAARPEVEIQCGGAPMVSLSDTNSGEATAATRGEQILVGKRYIDDEVGLELLCTKAGCGPLSIEDRTLTVKTARALPASD
jgi:hypothetical protein